MVNHLTGVFLAAAAFTATAAETVTNISIDPAPGVVTELGTPEIEYGIVPTPNPDCAEPATISLDGVVLSEIHTWESNRIQSGVMQSDTSIKLVFTTKRYTDPGTYVVTVPEGFCTFDEGKLISAALTFEYVVPYPTEYTVDPAAGYVDALGNTFVVTFPGAVSIVDNKKSATEEGTGAIRFDTPEIYYTPEVTIEGNRVTFIVGQALDVDKGDGNGGSVKDDEDYQRDEFTVPGRYRLSIYAGDLTLTMEDGSIVDNTDIIIEWLIPLIPFPALTPEPGEVESLSEVTVTLRGDDTFGVFNITPSVYAVSADGKVTDNRVSTTKRINPTGVVRGATSVTFALNSPVTEPGRYAFKIGKSSFSVQGPGHSLMDDVVTPIEYVYYYDVVTETSGVSEVESTDVPLEVVDLSGVCTGRNLTQAEFENLPAGFYIVNGKKILKK